MGLTLLTDEDLVNAADRWRSGEEIGWISRQIDGMHRLIGAPESWAVNTPVKYNRWKDRKSTNKWRHLDAIQRTKASSIFFAFFAFSGHQRLEQSSSKCRTLNTTFESKLGGLLGRFNTDWTGEFYVTSKRNCCIYIPFKNSFKNSKNQR